VAFDFKVLFMVIRKEPAAVTTADVFAFIKAQRAPRLGANAVRLEDGEAGLSARTIKRRLASVAAVTLDDIDWTRERLAVPERKAGHSMAFPLSKSVGEAIIEFLQHGRPKTSDRHVFFRPAAPLRPIGSPAVSSCARRYLLQAGVQVPRPASHTLRHTLVQRLVDAEFGKEIGDFVGPSVTGVDPDLRQGGRRVAPPSRPRVTGSRSSMAEELVSLAARFVIMRTGWVVSIIYAESTDRFLTIRPAHSHSGPWSQPVARRT
jgi:Phage integrase family